MLLPSVYKTIPGLQAPAAQIALVMRYTLTVHSKQEQEQGGLCLFSA